MNNANTNRAVTRSSSWIHKEILKAKDTIEWIDKMAKEAKEQEYDTLGGVLDPNYDCINLK